MAKRDKHYDQVYRRMRAVTSELLKGVHNEPDGGVVVAGAQAEALVRTLKGYTLRSIKPEFHAQYLHKLFSSVLTDVLDGMDHLTGKIIVIERPRSKKK
jgi:hypothetical protein